ncbi:MAG: ATP-binding cassette domain-containing protein [Candidatus Schekmanbacteria bacterium]|nr:ATP-binding cassette domain-containing protein [Candidatus Schekmanbacteria bacterium]
MIEVQNLTKKYSNLTALDNISFKVGKGSILGFLGPNGAGKTTAMRILTGYLPATEGYVKIAGFDVLSDPLQAKQSIGYLPENTPLYTQMRVRSYLEFMAELRNVPGAEIKNAVDKVIEKCRLTEVPRRIIRTLSKGYRQRVGIAQALVHNPPVLILDEPTIGLDPQQIIEVRQMIKELKSEHTVILSTHILPEVSAICDRVIILSKGKLVAEDAPDNLAQRIMGTAKITVAAKGPQNEIKAALGKIAGVTGVATQGKDNYHVESLPECDLRAAIAKTIVQNNWELLELRSCDVSLEEVFLHLITKEEEVLP